MFPTGNDLSSNTGQASRDMGVPSTIAPAGCNCPRAPSLLDASNPGPSAGRKRNGRGDSQVNNTYGKIGGGLAVVWTDRLVGTDGRGGHEDGPKGETPHTPHPPQWGAAKSLVLVELEGASDQPLRLTSDSAARWCMPL